MYWSHGETENWLNLLCTNAGSIAVVKFMPLGCTTFFNFTTTTRVKRFASRPRELLSISWFQFLQQSEVRIVNGKAPKQTLLPPLALFNVYFPRAFQIYVLPECFCEFWRRRCGVILRSNAFEIVKRGRQI